MLCTVVGAGPGLGAAIARRFLAEGYAVAGLARDATRLGGWAAELGPRAGAFPADAGDPDAVRRALADAHAWGGPTDVLVYNAAAMAPRSVDGLTADDLLATVRVDAGGLLSALGPVLPGMRERGHGTVLVTGGGLALEPYPAWSTLAAGKAALRSLTLSLHKQLAPEGVRVAVVAVCGVVREGGPFDPDLVADEYWRLHAEPAATGRRELVYLPEGADPFYNDPHGTHRATSLPIRASEDVSDTP